MTAEKKEETNKKKESGVTVDPKDVKVVFRPDGKAQVPSNPPKKVVEIEEKQIYW